jgi:hypothetical protein
MSKIAYECKKCGQKYRIKEGIEDISCQACEGDLRQVKMYSVSEYESLPEVPAEIKQATEGDLLEAPEIQGEVLPDAEDGINTEEKTDDSGEAETDNPDESEIEDLKVSNEPVEEIQPEITEGEE